MIFLLTTILLLIVETSVIFATELTQFISILFYKKVSSVLTVESSIFTVNSVEIFDIFLVELSVQKYS